jgi:hypothetical protein
MFSRILTEIERKRIKTYLKQDGERDVNIRQLVMRSRRHLPTIKQDLDLLERLVQAYDSHVKRGD